MTELVQSKHEVASRGFVPGFMAELAWQSARQVYLGSFHGSDIYQLPRGWQGDILLKAGLVNTVSSATTFEQAVQDPAVHAIYVPCMAALTQEIAMRILKRNALSKTIFWEI